VTDHRSGGPRLLLLTLLLGLLGAVAVSGAVLLLPADEVPTEEEPSAGQTGRPVTAEPHGVADPRAVQLLRRAAGAAAATSFTGTQMVSTWDREGAASYLLDVDNEPGAGLSVRVHSSATNPQGAGYTTAVAGAENVGSVGGVGSSAAGEELRLLLDSYDLSVERADRVAGRATTVVAASRPGAGVAARFWVDDASGLVLRREVYDTGGRMVRAAAFVDVDVDVAHFVKHPPPLLPGRSGQELSGAELAAWDERGWACPRTLPAGLRLVDARSTTAGAGEDRQGAAGRQPILHLTYSDGLSAVSVFQQRGELDRGGLTGYRAERWAGREVLVSEGFPRRVLWSAQGLVFTVVGDAADDAVDAAVAALPHDSESRSGVRERLRRGVERLGSWLDPFH
jgi:sigma-E factor negative regulatory protein RseB